MSKTLHGRTAIAALMPLATDCRRRWQGLSQRERRLLQLAGALLALLLLWAVLLHPALRTRRQAPADIATLQDQVLLLRQQAQQLVALRQLPAAAPAGDPLAAASAWLGSQQQSQAPQPIPGGMRLQLRQLPSAQLLALLARARRDWGVEAGAADLQIDTAQRVSGSLDLLQRGGASRAAP